MPAFSGHGLGTGLASKAGLARGGTEVACSWCVKLSGWLAGCQPVETGPTPVRTVPP